MSRSIKEKVTYEDKKPLPTENTINDYYTALKKMDTAIDKLDTKQTKMTVTINDTKPIGLAFSGVSQSRSSSIFDCFSVGIKLFIINSSGPNMPITTKR